MGNFIPWLLKNNNVIISHSSTISSPISDKRSYDDSDYDDGKEGDENSVLAEISTPLRSKGFDKKKDKYLTAKIKHQNVLVRIHRNPVLSLAREKFLIQLIQQYSTPLAMYFLLLLYIFF